MASVGSHSTPERDKEGRRKRKGCGEISPSREKKMRIGSVYNLLFDNGT
jgi:hypothetical protein